jgi:hypothetical protein
MEATRTPDDEAVERKVTAWFRLQPKEFYAAGFQGLVKLCASASMYREIMLRNKSIFQISTLTYLLIDLRTYNDRLNNCLQSSLVLLSSCK